MDSLAPERKLSDHCFEASKFYAEKPGLFGPATGIDLYCVCQMLSDRVEQLETKVQQLLEHVR